MIATHRIIITGKVQDIGFRDIVEHIGRSFGLPGQIFNQTDGSVKILCGGEDSIIEDFAYEIKIKGERKGAEIESFDNQIIQLDLNDLPEIFSKVSADDEIDIGRKLDKANFLLKSGFDSLNTDLNAGFNRMNTDLNTGFNRISTDLNAGFNRLAEILERNDDRKKGS